MPSRRFGLAFHRKNAAAALSSRIFTPVLLSTFTCVTFPGRSIVNRNKPLPLLCCVGAGFRIIWRESLYEMRDYVGRRRRWFKPIEATSADTAKDTPRVAFAGPLAYPPTLAVTSNSVG